MRPVVPPLVRKRRRASRPSLSRPALVLPLGGGRVAAAASGAARLYAPAPVGRGTGGRRAAEQQPRLWACAGPFLRISPATVPRRDPPSFPSGPCGPGGFWAWGNHPGAVPRPAPNSWLRTGADQGNPTV